MAELMAYSVLAQTLSAVVVIQRSVVFIATHFEKMGGKSALELSTLIQHPYVGIVTNNQGCTVNIIHKHQTNTRTYTQSDCSPGVVSPC